MSTAAIRAGRPGHVSSVAALRAHTALSPRAAVLGAAVFAALLNLPFLGRSPLYRDEAVTLSATTRPLSQLPHLLAHVDLVHGLFYLVMHGWVALGGTGAAWIRLPAALATIGAATGVAALGVRFGGPSTGLLAGVLVSGDQLVVAQADLARSYGAVLLLVVLVAVTALRLLDAPSLASSIPVALLAGCAGATHVFAGGLASAVILAAVGLEARRRRLPLLHFAVPLVAVLVTAGIVGGLAHGEAPGQLLWVKPPSPLRPLRTLTSSVGNVPATLVLLLAAAVGAVRGRREFPVQLLLAWLVVPSVVLLAYSYVSTHVYVDSYLTSGLVALALLAARGIVELGRPAARSWVAAGAAGVLLLAVVVPGARFASRRVRVDDAPTVAAFVAAHVRPGDAVVYDGDGARALFERALGPTASRLTDVLLITPAGPSGTLDGLERPAGSSRALATAPRVWLLATLLDGWPTFRASQRADLATVRAGRRQALIVSTGNTQGALFSR